MVLLHESVEFKKLDVRLIERNQARGVLSKDELEKALKKLPDDADNVEWVNIETLTHSEVAYSGNGRATHP